MTSIVEDIPTNLDRLNQLLQHEDLPSFRKTVSPSLNNLVWLRKALSRKAGVNPELISLLQLSPKQLHQPYTQCADQSQQNHG